MSSLCHFSALGRAPSIGNQREWRVCVCVCVCVFCTVFQRTDGLDEWGYPGNVIFFTSLLISRLLFRQSHAPGLTHGLVHAICVTCLELLRVARAPRRTDGEQRQWNEPLIDLRIENICPWTWGGRLGDSEESWEVAVHTKQRGSGEELFNWGVDLQKQHELL